MGRHFGLYLCLAFLAIIQGVQGQTERPAYASDRGNVSDAITRVQAGHFSNVHVEMIVRAHAVEAIPILTRQFDQSPDPVIKTFIASGLFRLGEKGDLYWAYLISSARSAVESDAPSFWEYDALGKPISAPSSAFIAWAKAHNETPDAAQEDALFTMPGAVTALGETGDRRAIPLLRQALLSPNLQIESQGARGLAHINDMDSVPLIIEACKHAPAEWAGEIARWLVYFDDVPSKSTVEKYTNQERANLTRDARAAGKSPYE
jgi:hypothetical protein